MQDDFDLDGLSVADAKAYVAEFIAAKKQVERDRAAKEEELDLWKKRTRLATEKGEVTLARESLARAEEIHQEVSRLKREERSLDFKVTELKRRLKSMEEQPEFTVNAGALLEQLEGVVGTDHETRDALKEAEAELALEELRRKMKAEEQQQEETEGE
jgi:phage shock protein A